MKSMNKVQLVGYLGKDPIIRQNENGSDRAILRLATDRFYTPRQGAVKKFTEWHTVVVWGQSQVEKLKNYIMKGSHILVDGSIRYSTYSDITGQIRNVTEIHANHLVDLDR
jgi:single-strand DNA-binding protein